MKGQEIDYNLQVFPLLIKTDSAVGSDDDLEVRFYKENDEIGRIEIWFSTPVKYEIHNCQDMTDFSSTLPSEVNKIWKITKLSGPRIIIECNGEEVVDITMSDDTCDRTKWRETYLNRDVKKIEFRGKVEASAKYYRPGKYYYREQGLCYQLGNSP